MIFALSMFPGCAGKMSVEQAKQVSVSMVDVPTFVPPPRRINDILTILDQPGQFDKSITENLKERADAVTPENADSRFFTRRGTAAIELGRPQQAIEDYREAMRRTEEAGIHNPNLMRFLATVESRIGNFSHAVELLEESLKISENPSTYARPVDTYIMAGRLEQADRAMRNAKRFCNSFPHRPPGFVLRCDIEIAGMEAALLEARAKFAEAEKFLRQRIKLMQMWKEERPGLIIQRKQHLAMNFLGQERLLEAEVEVRQALKESLGHGGKDSLLTVRIMATLANILRAQGRLSEAEKLASTAVDILESNGIPDKSNSMGTARMLLGSIRATKGDFTGAMREFMLATQGVREEQYFYKKNFMGNPNFILTLVMADRLDQAVRVTTNTYETAKKRFGEKHYITAERLAIRGLALYRMKKNPRGLPRSFYGDGHPYPSPDGERRFLKGQTPEDHPGRIYQSPGRHPRHTA
jgi:tetratricopeptide (TPR) repeat protein